MKNTKKMLAISLISGLVLLPNNTLALSKKETVYTNLDYNGVPTKTLVSNHLYVEKDENINDETELNDILNLNGKEKFDLSDKNLTWENKGKDIFYQGKTDKESLITISAKYYLNGKEKKVKDMLGKKGNVTIELTFTNNSYLEDKNVYTPVVTTVTTIINDDYNKNVKISTGKTLDTGTKTVVVGLASPGLYESTSIGELKDLDKLTISYETTKFSLSNIYFIATPKLLEESDFDIFDKIDTLSSSMNTIQDSMNKLESGSKELENGGVQLFNGTTELKDGLASALDAINKLEAGSVSLDNGLKEIITALSEAQAELNNKDIAGSMAQLNTLKEQNTNAINALTKTNATLEANYSTYGLANFKSEEEVVAYFTAKGLDAATITNLVTLKKSYEGNLNLIKLLTANNTAIDSTISSLTTISSSINELLTKLTDGLNKVENGASTLTGGLGELKVGVNKLYNGSVSLNEGASNLSNGATTLAEGISRLNKEGINTLTNYTNKYKKYSDKIKELVNLSNEYNGFTSNNADSTIFIYKMKSTK